MADEVLVLKGHGNVDVQIGGPGNAWDYLSACATLSGPTVPRGGTEIRWCQDPLVANGFKISSQFRTAPDQVSADLMTKLGKIDYLDQLNCPFSLRARFADCGERENPANYDPIMLSYCNTQLQEHSYDDLVIGDPGDQDEILVTAPWQSNYEYRVKKLTSPSRIGTAATLGDQAINDIEYCDAASCGGNCGARTDGCSIIYGVTDADTSPYAAPNLVKGVKSLTTQVVTWTTTPILGLNSDIEGVECAGNRVIVSSNGDGAIAYSDTPTDQDSWNVVSIANAPTANKNALFARTAREIWLGSVSGFIYKSLDGGISWTAVHSAEITSENINAVYAFDKDLVVAVGDNGVILKSTNGGQTWVDISETSTTAANLLAVVIPPGRPEEIYVGTNDGMIYRSTNEGGTLADTGDFAAMSFVGDGVGTVDDIDFCGPCGSDVMFILHNDSGPRGRVLRDLSGGNGGSDVEIISDYTQVIAAGVDLNALACCGVNEVIAAGELVSSYPVVISIA
jgi:hypothetical protein